MTGIKVKSKKNKKRNLIDSIRKSVRNFFTSPRMANLKAEYRNHWNRCVWRGDMLVEGSKAFFSKFKLLAYIALCILFCYLGYKLMQANWSFVQDIYSDTTMVGLIGTLLGAVIGGVFSLLGSVTVSKQQIKAQNQIRRKNVIYKPLYDELVEIHYDILKQNPYPGIIQFQKGHQTFRPHPQFAVWGRIKSDSRYLETPRKLTRLMDKLEDEIKGYRYCFDNACISINAVVDCVLQHETGAECTIGNIADSILEYIMLRSTDKLFECYSDFLSPVKELNNSERLRISGIIIDECWKCESVSELNQVYQAWLQTEEQAIKLLSAMIRRVNVSYEE